MNSILEQINSMGAAFVQFALPVLVQSSVLIVILLAVDFLLRNRVRAVFRYWLWMLVLVKLVLPPGLSSPVSVGHWLGSQLQSVKAIAITTDMAEVDVPQMAEPAFVEVGGTTGAIAGRGGHFASRLGYTGSAGNVAGIAIFGLAGCRGSYDAITAAAGDVCVRPGRTGQKSRRGDGRYVSVLL